MIDDLDDATRYRACSGRDARFDGRFFLGVTSTGVYCRPSCPARTPLPQNCRYFPSAAAAVAAGYRACKRCRPDRLAAHHPATSGLAARAVQLIRDGVVDAEGISGLSARLGVSERHLHRLLTAEVGASAQQLNQTRRAQVARTLIDQTPLSLTDIAFAAGFGSVRQFNDVMRAEFGVAPSALRGPEATDRTEGMDAAQLVVRLPYRGQLHWPSMRRQLAAHAVPGVERVAADEHRRLVPTPYGHGLAAVRLPDEHARGQLTVRIAAPELAAVLPMISAVRRWLDLDADSPTIDEALAPDAVLVPLVAARPGLRVPGTVDGTELALFVVLGQQISVRAARTVQARLVGEFGQPTAIGDDWRSSPTAAALFEAGPERIREALRLTRAKAATMHALAGAIASGLRLEPGVDLAETRARLLALPGVGPWTAESIVMRALGDPDAFPASDLVLRRGLGVTTERAVGTTGNRWRPWRAYGAMHIWTKETYS